MSSKHGNKELQLAEMGLKGQRVQYIHVWAYTGLC